MISWEIDDDLESGTIRSVFSANSARVESDDTVADRETEALAIDIMASPAVIIANEAFKNVLQFCGGKARALVGEGERPALIRKRGGQGDRASGGGDVEGVADEVKKELAQ